MPSSLPEQFILLVERTAMQVDPGDNRASWLPSLGLVVARLSIAAWIGAASLFVVVGVIEVTRGGFDSTTKDMLVSLRFPAFYTFGATLVGFGWIGVWLSGSGTGLSRRRRAGALTLLAIAAILMAVDYSCIYCPLSQMVTPPGQSKPASFMAYHSASKWINLAGLLLCLTASILINWPVRNDNSGKM